MAPKDEVLREYLRQQKPNNDDYDDDKEEEEEGNEPSQRDKHGMY